MSEVFLSVLQAMGITIAMVWLSVIVAMYKTSMAPAVFGGCLATLIVLGVAGLLYMIWLAVGI